MPAADEPRIVRYCEGAKLGAIPSRIMIGSTIGRHLPVKPQQKSTETAASCCVDVCFGETSISLTDDQLLVPTIRSLFPRTGSLLPGGSGNRPLRSSTVVGVQNARFTRRVPRGVSQNAQAPWCSTSRLAGKSMAPRPSRAPAQRGELGAAP